MKRAMATLFVVIILCSPPFALADVSSVEGKIDLVEQDQITIDNRKYKVVTSSSEDAVVYGFLTECWVVEPTESYQIDYKTLFNVGYVDAARVTIENGVVRKIEILELLQ